jgi:hypothetical protein
MSKPDLDHARTYLEPSRWENSWLSRIAWQAWPAAILIALAAVFAARTMIRPVGSSEYEMMINFMQQFHDAPIVMLALAGFALFHVVANLGFLAFDRSKAFGWRLLDAASILLTLVVIAVCVTIAAYFQNPTPTP